MIFISGMEGQVMKIRGSTNSMSGRGKFLYKNQACGSDPGLYRPDGLGSCQGNLTVFITCTVHRYRLPEGIRETVDHPVNIIGDEF